MEKIHDSLIELLNIYLNNRDQYSEEEKSIILNTLRLINIQLENESGK